MTTTTDRGALVRALAESLRDERGALLPVLHAVMEDCGHVTHDDMVVVADVLNLSVADVHGVVSFYEDFRTTPPAAHEVRICRGEACQSVGAERLFEESAASVVTASGDVAHSQVFCLGNCALGPSALVDGALHGRMTQERLVELTAGWRA